MRKFDYVHGTSDKFWFIQQPTEAQGAAKYWIVLLRYGRNGTTGQTHISSFPSELAAQTYYQKKIKEQLAQGYKERPTVLDNFQKLVDHAPLPAPAPKPTKKLKPPTLEPADISKMIESASASLSKFIDNAMIGGIKPATTISNLPPVPGPCAHLLRQTPHGWQCQSCGHVLVGTVPVVPDEPMEKTVKRFMDLD